jgi:hypothetical protein
MARRQRDTALIVNSVEQWLSETVTPITEGSHRGSQRCASSGSLKNQVPSLKK